MSSRLKRLAAVALVALATGLPVLAEEPAAPQSDPASAEAGIRALDQAWAAAEDRRDVAAIERFLADSYVFVGEDGQLFDRASYIAAVSGYHGKSSQEVSSDVVHINRDTAISVGRITVTEATAGQPNVATYRYTNAFVWRSGQWRAVSTQVSTLNPPNTLTEAHQPSEPRTLPASP